MYGAILGDIIGSVYEFNNVKSKSFQILGDASHITDDTVMTIAIAEALMKSLSIQNYEISKEDITKECIIGSMKKWGRRYPNAGYGGRFLQWLNNHEKEPYNSWGNGSAMRVSSVGWLFGDIDTTRRVARWTAEVTHNHPEGIKGAEAVATAIYLARTGEYKSHIKEYITQEFGYNLERKIDEIRPTYQFDVSCQGSIPEAIIAFLEGTDLFDVIRTAISIGGDSDTIAAIAGSIAEAYYWEDHRDRGIIHKKVTDEMWNVIDTFDHRYRRRRVNKEEREPFHIFRHRIKMLPEKESKIAEFYRLSQNRTKTKEAFDIDDETLMFVLRKIRSYGWDSSFGDDNDVVSYINELSPIKVKLAKEIKKLNIMCGTGFTEEDDFIARIFSQVEGGMDYSVRELSIITGMPERIVERSVSNVKCRMNREYKDYLD